MTNQSKVGKQFSIKKILSAVIATLLIVSIFATPALADSFNSYDVNLIVDSEAITVTTNETEPIEILKNAGFTISDNDKMDITSFEEGVGGEIVVKKLKSIYVEQNGKINQYDVYSSTVGEALNELGVTVNEKDKANYNLTDKIINGMVITIKKAFSVTLIADGKTKKYTVIDGTVKSLLNQAGITLGEDDYTKPALNESLTNNAKVTVYRVEYKQETKTEAIKYSTKQQKDNKLEIGKTKTLQEGKNGSKSVTYKVKYVNGKASKSEVLSETVLSKPTDKIIKVGTKAGDVKPNGVTSKNGYTVGQTISGRYTHYCVCSTCNGNSRGITASGRRIWNGMANPYYIACNWLPLGSVIKVDGQNYTVVDRGGSGLSRQGRIDIFTPAGHSAALRAGTGNCTITIVRLGW